MAVSLGLCGRVTPARLVPLQRRSVGSHLQHCKGVSVSSTAAIRNRIYYLFQFNPGYLRSLLREAQFDIAMAEILGAVSASIHLTEKVTKYCRSFKSASADAGKLADELAAVDQVLQTLQQLMQRPPPGLVFKQTSSLLPSIQQCERRMRVLEANLAPHASKLGRLLKRAKWPLDHQETLATVEALHRCVQIFHFATTLDGL